jgi:aryl-alcohol dehydrogenase-like predicted oxidoreductase
METRRLGDSDVEVSVVGLGCNQFGRKLDLNGTRAVIDAAIEAGVTFLDTADIYGGSGRSEELMGEALRGKRDRVVLATKFGMDFGGGEKHRGRPEYVRASIEGSLRRLQTDHVDVYWLHQPDPETPIAETLGALDELVRAGTVRAIGCSNFEAAQLEEADAAARDNGFARFVAVQNEYSLLDRSIEDEVVPVCERLNVSIVPYYPLARGLLTGKYRRGEAAPADSRLAGRESIASDEEFAVVEKLEAFASARGVSITDVAIGGLAAQPEVASVIAGATKPEQVHSNAAAGEWKPSAEDLSELGSIAAGLTHP